MQKDQQKLAQLIQGKKVAFIGAGVSHKTLIKEFVELGAHVTLCDQKRAWRTLAITPPPSGNWAST